MKRILVVAVLAAMATGCAPSDAEVRGAAMSSGLTDVRVGGRTPLGCGEDDHFFGRKFVAHNAAGQPVSGTVCCGHALNFKGCTVRY